MGTELQTLRCIKYIHMNPVKAHIVEKEEEYQFSSYNNYRNNNYISNNYINDNFINKNEFINSKILNSIFNSEENYTEKLNNM